MKSIILAAGLGTRMRGISNITPKPLLPVGKNKLIDFTIELSLSLFLEPIVILGFKNGDLENYLDKRWPSIKYITTVHEFTDLTLSLKGAERYVDDDFLWLGADTIFLDTDRIKEMIKYGKKTKRFGLFYCHSKKFTPKITLKEKNEILDFDVTGLSRSTLSSPTIFVSLA